MCEADYEIANQLSFLTRRTGPLKSETVASCNSMFEKKLVKIKYFGIWLHYDHMFKEPRELSEENTYQDVAAKRHACFKSIRVRLQASYKYLRYTFIENYSS